MTRSNATTRWGIAALLFVLGASFSSAQAQTVIRCESQNEGYRHCPINLGRQEVQLQRQLSKSDCRLNETWGYDNRGIWVDRGCRAEFALYRQQGGFNNRPNYGNSGNFDSVVRCESVDRKRKFCQVDTSGGVELERQLSDANCVYRRTWDYNHNGIWVEQGCRAEFRVRQRGHSSGGFTGGNRGQIVRCESIDNRRAYCRVNTRRGVQIERQLSDSDCIQSRTWGYDHDGIWVSSGCRAEFRVGR